jgi:hypothetical protein
MQAVCQFPLHIESPPSFEPKQMASRLSDETDKEALLQLQEEEEDDHEDHEDQEEFDHEDHEEVLQSVGQIPSIGSS